MHVTVVDAAGDGQRHGAVGVRDHAAERFDGVGRLAELAGQLGADGLAEVAQDGRVVVAGPFGRHMAVAPVDDGGGRRVAGLGELGEDAAAVGRGVGDELGRLERRDAREGAVGVELVEHAGALEHTSARHGVAGGPVHPAALGDVGVECPDHLLVDGCRVHDAPGPAFGPRGQPAAQRRQPLVGCVQSRRRHVVCLPVSPPLCSFQSTAGPEPRPVCGRVVRGPVRSGYPADLSHVKGICYGTSFRRPATAGRRPCRAVRLRRARGPDRRPAVAAPRAAVGRRRCGVGRYMPRFGSQRPR